MKILKMKCEMDPNFQNTKWPRKQTSNRSLVILSSILLLVALILAIALAILIYKTYEHTERDICLTPGCVHAASIILNYLDESADPCDDFYEFACGSLLNNTKVPEGATSISSYMRINTIIMDRLKSIIQEPLPPNASKPQHIYKKIYDMCMNTTTIEKNGLATVESLLKDLGGWPLLENDNWNEGKFEWKQSIYKFRKFGLGISHFIGFYVTTDIKNSTSRMIEIDEPNFGLSREYLIKGTSDKFVKAYYDYMVDEAVLFGANRAAALKEISEILELEIAIAKLCLPIEETRNITALYNPMTIEELQDYYPIVPWLEYITRVLDIPDIDITEDEIINVKVPRFLTNVDSLLRRTPKRIQANYLMGKVAFSTVYALPERFRNRKDDYNKIFSGRTDATARSLDCIYKALGSTYLAISSSYVRKYFDHDSKTQVMEMVNNIQNEFVEILKTSSWMDEKTRVKGIEKAKSIVAHVGYPDELLDDKKIEKFYLNLDVTSHDYLETKLALTLFKTDYYYKQLREPVNKTDWVRQSYSTAVNAFYSASENSIKIPAAILQGRFFNKDRPRYMNYGGIGYTIGHEITHGFDDIGRQFDKDGNLLDWWAEDTLAAFTKKAQCIIDQYGNYTVPEINLNLNGVTTQGENIADNGGIKGAYMAYQTWVAHNGLEPKLPGLDYTPNQMFWISAANAMCAKYKNEVQTTRITTSPHSPEKFRILGPFSNSEYFANDFNCPLGSNMNPENKCKVW